ncbi:MAG TPA: hypothetical protein ENN45_02460 [Bacteroidetes bacterium]|nr:hypothetical protein [Bacteroidota bacterium]
MNFCPPVVPQSGTGGGKRFRNSALAEYQNRKIFVSFIEKIFARGRLKNVRKFFCFARRSEAEAGGNTGAGLKFKIWIFVKKSSDFNQKAPPIYNFSVLCEVCLALASLGLGFGKDFERIFEIQKQFLPAQAEVRFAEGKHKFEKFINQSFFFRL